MRAHLLTTWYLRKQFKAEENQLAPVWSAHIWALSGTAKLLLDVRDFKAAMMEFIHRLLNIVRTKAIAVWTSESEIRGPSLPISIASLVAEKHRSPSWLASVWQYETVAIFIINKSDTFDLHAHRKAQTENLVSALMYKDIACDMRPCAGFPWHLNLSRGRSPIWLLIRLPDGSLQPIPAKWSSLFVPVGSSVVYSPQNPYHRRWRRNEPSGDSPISAFSLSAHIMQ